MWNSSWTMSKPTRYAVRSGLTFQALRPKIEHILPLIRAIHQNLVTAKYEAIRFMPVKDTLKALLEETYGLLNHSKNSEKLFDFEDRELSVIREEGEDNFLEMHRTWMNEEGGDLSFIKAADKNTPQIQNFGRGRSHKLLLTASATESGTLASPGP